MVKVTVDPWRLSLLKETARKRFGPYAKYFVLAWIKNILKDGPLPKDEQEWAENEEEKE